MGKPTTTSTDVLAKLFKNTALPFDAIGNLYVSLHTSLPTGSDQTSNESAYTSYARVAVSRDAAGWTVAAGQSQNTALVQFPKCTGGSSVVTHIGIGTLSAGVGQLLYVGTIADGGLTVSNNIVPTFNATSITITEA